MSTIRKYRRKAISHGYRRTSFLKENAHARGTLYVSSHWSIIKVMAADLAINNSAEFQEKVLGSDVPVLVDFWAPWCGPCRAIAPAVEELANEYSGKAKVFKIDVDQVGEVAQNYGVMSIPALLVFKDGKVVDKQVGAGPKSQIAALLDRAIN
jgi:thioredoxin 1